MKVKFGLCEPNPGWRIIFDQEGFEYETKLIENPIVFDNYSLIIPTSECLEKHKDYFFQNKTKKIVILDKETWPILFDYKQKTQRIKFLKPDDKNLCYDVGLIDFYTSFLIPISSELKEIDHQLRITYLDDQDTIFVLLPFSVNELMTDVSYMRKRFYAKRKELPSEVVATVNKGKIRNLISSVLLWSLSQFNLPMIHKRYIPKGSDNLFIFRIDTDFCNASDAHNLYNLCKEYDIRATWFVDTQNEKMLSDVYSRFTDHEIALHCEKHQVFDTYEENKKNIDDALTKMKRCNLQPRGFAAPFGEWNISLGKVLEDLNFDYSSEFALDYDDVPFFPYYNDRYSSVLQVPIHPISIGRLRRSHFTENEMIDYYSMIIDDKLSRNEPIILYHHPHHEKLEVIRHIFMKLQNKKLWNPTMLEYSNWWKQRVNAPFSINVTNKTIHIDCEDPNLSFQILDVNKGSAVIESNKPFMIENLSFQKRKILNLDESVLMRKFYWRDVLYNFEQKRAKKRS